MRRELFLVWLVAAWSWAGIAEAVPKTHEPGWRLTRTDLLPWTCGAAHYNPADGHLYVARREERGGIYRIETNGFATKLCDSDRPAGIVAAADGDVFFSEDHGGTIFRFAFRGVGRDVWVSGFHDGDDDPMGMAIAPASYKGDVLRPGQALVVDRGWDGPAEVWLWSPDAPEEEVPIHTDDGTIVDTMDVAIGTVDVFVLDGRCEDPEPGRIHRLGGDGKLTPLPLSEPLLLPVGMAWDPASGSLLVAVWSAGAVGDRVVRVDPTSGTVTDFITNELAFLGLYAFVGIDIRPDGYQVYVTKKTGEVQTFTQCDASRRADPCDLNGNGVADECELAETPFLGAGGDDG